MGPADSVGRTRRAWTYGRPALSMAPADPIRRTERRVVIGP